MVKKVDSTWSSFPISSSSVINVQKYIDACQNWLVTPPVKDVNDHPSFFYNKKVDFTYDPSTYVGMNDLEIRHLNNFDCFVCRNRFQIENGKTLVANPFTRSQYMLLCYDCHSTITSFR